MTRILTPRQTLASVMVGSVLGLLVVAASGRSSQEVHAWDAAAGNFRFLYITEGNSDRFYNYDNLDMSLPPSAHNVDFALTMVFTNGASKTKVRNGLALGIYDCEGGQENLRLNDGASWRWDWD